MNLLLELVRLAINHDDIERHYATAIREHLQAHEGRPSAQWREVRDSLQAGRRVSTSSLRYWVA